MGMTHKELAWLCGHIGEYRRVQADPNQQIKSWLRTTLIPKFFEDFPDYPATETKDMVQRFVNWFSYHSKTSNAEPSGAVALPLSTTLKRKKPAAIAPWQAYSLLYFGKGTALHKEVHVHYEDFKAGVETVRLKYLHLFLDSDDSTLSTISWLRFYQAVMMEHVKNLSTEELATVTQYIHDRYQRDIDRYERPWDSVPGSGNESEVVKKRRYLAEQIRSLPDSLKGAYRDIEEMTNFRAFTLLGGPSPDGQGGLSIMRVQTGRALDDQEHGDFESFLGDIYPLLKEKWCQWLAKTYTHEQLHCAVASESSPTPTPPDLSTMSMSATPPSPRQPTPNPDHFHPGWNHPAVLTSLTPPPTQQPAQRSPSPESPPRTHSPPTLRQPLRLAYVAVPLHTRKRSLPLDDVSDETSCSDTDQDYKGASVWVLDGRHPAFLHAGQEFLLNIPGGDDWQTLLSRYVKFEGLTPPVQGKLSTSSRPNAVGWWFRHGRRNFNKLPPIESLCGYEKSWIAWWTALQPDWRNTDNWPFPQDTSTSGPWDDLLVGSKDGLFVVVMTLAWWSIEHAKVGVELLQLNAAIADVSWVLINLISVLSTKDSGARPLPVSAETRKYHSRISRKVGPPRKRLRS